MKKSTLSSFLLFTIASFSQTVDYKNAPNVKGSNYFEITQKVRKELNATSTEAVKNGAAKKTAFEQKVENKKVKQFERWAYYWKDRVSIDGTFPNQLEGWYNAGIIDAEGKVSIQNKKSSQTSKTSSQSWTNIGPSSYPEKNGYSNYPQLGRLTNFLRYKHATNSNLNVLFVSAPDGGVWKSTDNGTTWSPKLDNIAGIGVTDIKSSSTDINTPGTIYIATGDYDGVHIGTLGVYKSTDFGETFTPTALTFSLNETETLSNLIVIDANTVIVATKQYIKKTTDGGATWVNKFTGAYENSSIGKFHRNGTNIMATSSWGGILYSKDNGDTWTALVAEDGITYRRSAITSDAATGIFYLQNKTGQVSTCDLTVANPELTNIGVPTPTYADQGAYNQSLAVKNGLILSGSLNIMTSKDNGATWQKSINADWKGTTDDGTYGHADVHELGTLDDGYSFYSINDGGLDFITFSSIDDIKPTVEYKSNGVVNTQMYSVAISPQSEDHIIVGNQDNDGYSQEMHGGTLKWVAAAAGDGTCTAIDYTNSGIRYLGAQKGGLTRVDSGFSGNYEGTSLTTPTTNAPFVWTLKLHSTTPTTLYGGFAEIYKSTNKGDSWTNLNSGAGVIEYIENYNSNLFVIGETSAKKSTNDGASWTTLAQPVTTAKMNSISVNQSNPLIVYATVNGYVSGSKVFKSEDGGSTWTNISTGLPNVLMKQIVLKQNESSEILFAGTEIGAYVKVGSADWTKLGTGLPNVIVSDMDINYGVDKLIVATKGRGLWQINIASTTLATNVINIPATEVLSLYPNPVTNGELNVQLKNNTKYEYMIYNIVGGQIAKGTLENSSNTIPLNNAANGLYILKLIDGNKVTTQKFLIKN